MLTLMLLLMLLPMFSCAITDAHIYKFTFNFTFHLTFLLPDQHDHIPLACLLASTRSCTTDRPMHHLMTNTGIFACCTT